MAEQLLDHAQVRTTVEQMGREAVPERVGRNAFRQTCRDSEAIEAPANSSRTQSSPPMVEE
jgi:hypothetical protein